MNLCSLWMVFGKRWSPVLMAVIVGSLCFSVGEGLRLTPFPVSAQLEESKDVADRALSKYGPLDVPSHVQKPSKRQTTDFAPPSQSASCSSVTFVFQRLEDQSVQLSSSLFVSRPSGRAPPFRP